MTGEEETKRKILTEKLKGRTPSQIAGRLGLTTDEVNARLAELRHDIKRINLEDEMSYYLSETFALFSQLERSAWSEFEYSEDPNVRIKILNSIAAFRKDAIRLRSDLGVLEEKEDRSIPFEKLKEIPEKVRIEISRIVVNRLENIEDLEEPVPVAMKLLDKPAAPMLSSVSDGDTSDEG